MYQIIDKWLCNSYPNPLPQVAAVYTPACGNCLQSIQPDSRNQRPVKLQRINQSMANRDCLRKQSPNPKPKPKPTSKPTPTSPYNEQREQFQRTATVVIVILARPSRSRTPAPRPGSTFDKGEGEGEGATACRTGNADDARCALQCAGKTPPCVFLEKLNNAADAGTMI